MLKTNFKSQPSGEKGSLGGKLLYKQSTQSNMTGVMKNKKKSMKDCLLPDPFHTSSTSFSVPVAPYYSVHSSYGQPQIVLKVHFLLKPPPLIFISKVVSTQWVLSEQVLANTRITALEYICQSISAPLLVLGPPTRDQNLRMLKAHIQKDPELVRGPHSPFCIC